MINEIFPHLCKHGRVPFDQKFRNFRKGEKWEKFQKIRKLLNFRKANHSTKNSGNFGMTESNGTGISRKNFSKIWVYLTRLSRLSEKSFDFVARSAASRPKQRPLCGLTYSTLKFMRSTCGKCRGCALFGNQCKFPIFYSALAISFGRDHSELDVSSKDDAHSIKETLLNLPTYMTINNSYS